MTQPSIQAVLQFVPLDEHVAMKMTEVARQDLHKRIPGPPLSPPFRKRTQVHIVKVSNFEQTANIPVTTISAL